MSGKHHPALEKYTGNINNVEAAYQITYVVTGHDPRAPHEKQYRDPDTSRTGNIFIGSIFLPKELAHKAFTEVQKNPRLLRQIFQRFDPDIMQDQKNHMPTDDKIFILPEGKASEAYIQNDRNIPEQIKSEYIKNID